GTYYMGLTAEGFTAASNNYTNIEILVEDGWLKIDPKNGLTVNIKGNQKTVTYTGSEQSVSGFTTDAPTSVTVALKSESKAEA
ncbi:hypothetical protein OSL60_27980, partial [Escherichia coli]|nr:hypothetical protein [Escherichia coli]